MNKNNKMIYINANNSKIIFVYIKKSKKKKKQNKGTINKKSNNK